ncbi:MAG: Sensory/regulatory protein RpfC [Stenotrophomonas maltophilia]|nr:MAG: Sensory/regulatory protein RpfC [Stenotrophomonas maltophilia]
MRRLFHFQDLELSQAQLRLVVALSVSLYTVLVFAMDMLGGARLLGILGSSVVFTLLAVALLVHMLRYPGASFRRRLLGMLLDNSGAALVMILGGETLLPVFCVLLSMTVGNGVRFGRGYLLLATGLGLLSLGCVALFQPFLREHPAVLVLMLLTLLVLPAFSYFLLGRLQRAMQQARAADQAKSMFLAQASHDLRQPIHAIGLFTACLRDTPLDSEQRQLVDNVDRSLLGVEQLFRSLLDIYTLDQSQVQPNWQGVDLAALFADLGRQNQEAARWAGVDLRLRAARRHVWCDPVLLTTLLQNLVSNALKYAPGQPLLIGCRQCGGRLSIQVHDRGPGIAAEHLPRLFEEFYRVREARDRDVEGVGLGLSIVERIAGLLDLDVRLASRLGHGTSVSIDGLLPVAAPAPRAMPVRDWSAGQLAGVRVLLIDDDANVRQAMAALLARWGCEVHAAAGIAEVSAACDVVLTDFDLGRDASGADCVAYLQALHGRAIPAIVLTGHEVGRVRQALGDERVPILSKPVRPAELRSLLLSLRLAPGVQPSPSP